MYYLISKSSKLTKLQKLVFISLLLSQALVLSYVERFIPLNFIAVPGAKLGLANIITLTGLYFLSFKEMFTFVILRTILTTFITGSVSGFLYTFSGAMLSFLVMYLLLVIGKERFSTIGISVVGAIFHNIGQLIMAGFVMENFNIFYYLPFLMITGVVTGIVVGLTVRYLLNFMKKLKYFD